MAVHVDVFISTYQDLVPSFKSLQTLFLKLTDARRRTTFPVIKFKSITAR